MQSALGLGGLSITMEYTGHSAGIHTCMHMYMYSRQQFFFERLLPWDLICISFLCLSQVSEYLSCTCI